jgi:hypothetical protein
MLSAVAHHAPPALVRRSMNKVNVLVLRNMSTACEKYSCQLHSMKKTPQFTHVAPLSAKLCIVFHSSRYHFFFFFLPRLPRG